jgi:hypothetical protein
MSFHEILSIPRIQLLETCKTNITGKPLLYGLQRDAESIVWTRVLFVSAVQSLPAVNGTVHAPPS